MSILRDRGIYLSRMARHTHAKLLAVDAAINAVLGLLLLLAPGPTIAALGLPAPGNHLYVTVLGAVLTGIAVALWIEGRGDRPGQGLGLAGAIAINLFGALTVLAWLLFGDLDLTWRGLAVLWTVALVVLATAIAELAAMIRTGT